MNPPVLPQNVTRFEDGESFCFACHPAIACFTDCCRQLELPLTPYDILRLKKACALTSEEFLDRFVIIEHDGQEAFPRFYLSMVDDGRESCVFVAKAGCAVYEDRPGACRAYPLGRAAIRQTNGDMGNRAVRMDEFFVLLKESHCQGFAEQQPHTASSYSTEQGLERYNHFNDAVAAILQHDQIRQGKKLSEKQLDLFTLALYNLDSFRTRLFAGNLPDCPPLDDTTTIRLINDEELLLYGIQWLEKQLFGNHA